MTKLTLAKYEENAHSTIAASTQEHLDVAFNPELVGLLRRYVEICKTIDVYKKACFYGRDIESYPTPLKPLNRNGIDSGVIHGVLGIAGEAGEVVELLLEAIDTGTIPEKFSEELGDVLWYIAVGARAAGSSLEEVGRGNNTKLQDRWAAKQGANDFKS